MKDVKNGVICTDKDGNIIPGRIDETGIWMYETKFGPSGRLMDLKAIIVVPDDKEDRSSRDKNWLCRHMNLIYE